MSRHIPYCPGCNSRDTVVRVGFRYTKLKRIQKYFCKACRKNFSRVLFKHTSYSPIIILSAVSTYNLGYSLAQTRILTNRRFKTKLPQSTLHSWLKRYQNLCSFTTTLRKHYKLDPYSLIYSKKLYHQQVYEFKYHTLKLNIVGKNFPRLKSYIKNIPRKCPNQVFKYGPRCSSLRIDLKPAKTARTNNALKLAELALTLAKTSRERHERVENFMLINDAATIAIETPVYLYPDELTVKERRTYGLELQEPLSGHIDILQVRWNNIHILDYKPDSKPTDKHAAEQLFLYALALSKRTTLPLKNFICAYFDENNYYQFKPNFK